MGCDIHGGLEIKDLNGKWHKYNPIIRDLSDFNKTYTSELPLGRDYTLFSILEKDHPRNYDNVKSIAPERGLPKDTAWYDDLDDIDFWGHSYVTLGEIQKFAEKNPLIKKSGYVLKEDYQKLQTGGIDAPNCSWQDGSSDMTHYHAVWSTISPIVDLSGYLTYLISMYNDQCFTHLDENNYNQVMLNKYYHWMNNSNNNIRLVFAFDN